MLRKNRVLRNYNVNVIGMKKKKIIFVVVIMKIMTIMNMPYLIFILN